MESDLKAALAAHGVAVPEGMAVGEVAGLVGELLKAVVEAKALGRFDLVKHRIPLGNELWTLRLRGHRQ